MEVERERRKRENSVHSRKRIEIVESLRILYKIITINGTPGSKLEDFEHIRAVF